MIRNLDEFNALLREFVTPSPAPSEPDPPLRETEFIATLRIDAQAGKKDFQGVWLERENGVRWLIDYRANGCWTSFDGHQVRVSGSRTIPTGQAISAVHYQVESLTLMPTPNHSPLVVSVGGELHLQGRLSRSTGSPGSKAEGSIRLNLVSEVGSWQIQNPSIVANHQDGPLEFWGRPIELSPFAAHAPGPRIWLLSVQPL